VAAYDLVVRVRAELDEDQEMISGYQLGLLIIDWTDPQKAVAEFVFISWTAS
jgi:condensin complex subunit 3